MGGGGLEQEIACYEEATSYEDAYQEERQDSKEAKGNIPPASGHREPSGYLVLDEGNGEKTRGSSHRRTLSTRKSSSRSEVVKRKHSSSRDRKADDITSPRHFAIRKKDREPMEHEEEEESKRDKRKTKDKREKKKGSKGKEKGGFNVNMANQNSINMSGVRTGNAAEGKAKESDESDEELKSMRAKLERMKLEQDSRACEKRLPKAKKNGIDNSSSNEEDEDYVLLTPRPAGSDHKAKTTGTTVNKRGRFTAAGFEDPDDEFARRAPTQNALYASSWTRKQKREWLREMTRRGKSIEEGDRQLRREAEADAREMGMSCSVFLKGARKRAWQYATGFGPAIGQAMSGSRAYGYGRVAYTFPYGYAAGPVYAQMPSQTVATVRTRTSRGAGVAYTEEFESSERFRMRM